MTYDKGSWGTYAWDPSKSREENLLSAERLAAAVTKSKMDNIEDGIANAHIKTKELEQVKADKVSLQNLDNKKADNDRVDYLERIKADITYVESMAEGQVNNIDFDNAREEDKTYVDTEIDQLDEKKADKTYVDAEIDQLDEKKADKTYVDEEDAKIIAQLEKDLENLQYERGSNDDGTYIKFGDGTLIQYSNHNVLAYVDNSALAKNWDFPMPFVNSFFVVAWTGLTHVAGKNDFHHEYSNTAVYRTSLVARGNTNQFSPEDSIQVGAIAIGRHM